MRKVYLTEIFTNVGVQKLLKLVETFLRLMEESYLRKSLQ